MATLDVLRDLVPPMVSVPDATCNRWLGYAAERLDVTEWGTLFVQGVCYLAGHMYLRSVATSAGGGAGSVTAESAGGMSRSYGSIAGLSAADAEYGTTAPGLAFLQLRREAIMTPMMFAPPTDYAVR